MTLNGETLGEATKARDHLLDLQHKTETARVDYHHLIRQLHVKGGSLREIAEALGISHQRVHQIVEPVDGSSGHPKHGPGPMHRMHRRMRGFVGFERFTSEARQVVVDALDQAGELGHRRIGTEHLVLGVAAAPAESRAGKALAALGITRDSLQAKVVERLGQGPATLHGRRPFSPAARRSLERALVAAKERKETHLGAEHILLGVIADAGDGAAILSELGATSDTVRAAIDAA